MHRTALVLFAPMVLGGCQCFVPVDEWAPQRPGPWDVGAPDAGAQDAGADGGVDAGLDAGPAPECVRASDCAPARDGGYPFCPNASSSCIDGRCLTECSAQRTCAVTDGGICLTCSEPAQVQCSRCVWARVCTFQVTSAECSGHFQAGAQLTLGSSGFVPGCGGPITPDDAGAAVGSWQDLGSGHALFWIPELGGYCTGVGLPTGAPRMLVGCPDCTFVEVGCE